MAISKKALVVCMAVLVVWVPVFAQPILLGVFPTKQAAEQALGISPTASQSSVVLPQGKELSTIQLQDTKGDGLIGWFAGTVFGGIIGVVVAPVAYGIHCGIFSVPFTISGLGHAFVDGAVGGSIAGGLTGLLLPEP